MPRRLIAKSPLGEVTAGETGAEDFMVETSAGLRFKPEDAELNWLLEGYAEAETQGIVADDPMMKVFVAAWIEGLIAKRTGEMGELEWEAAMRVGGAIGFRRIVQGLPR